MHIRRVSGRSIRRKERTLSVSADRLTANTVSCVCCMIRLLIVSSSYPNARITAAHVRAFWCVGSSITCSEWMNNFIFSSRFCSSDTKFSPCSWPIYVTTPIVGRIIFSNRSISPGCEMPASKIHNVGFSLLTTLYSLLTTSQTLSGTPICEL